MPKARIRRLFGLAAALAAAASCDATDTARPEIPAQARAGVSQGWDGEQRSRWYWWGQGSRLVPYAWLAALEQPDNDRPFLDPAHIEGFRYLTEPGARLPVGFAIDEQDDSRLFRTRLRWKGGQRPNEQWVGMTCSACHTAEITYAGQPPLRVQGGPTLADFQGFIEAFNLSLSRTADDPAKWDRFADGVLGGDGADTPRGRADRAMLKRAFARLQSWQAQQLRMNRTPLRYGYGRLDAFGHIYNKVALVASPRNATPNPADAPVSYPFLWNIHQLNHVQYNAIVANSPVRAPFRDDGTFDVGALGRNTGEVIGVFADVTPRRGSRLDGFGSSIDVKRLVALEQQLMTLRPPEWPAGFPAIDEGLAAEGEALFRANCASCHLPLQGLETRVPDRISFFNDASQRLPGVDPQPGPNSPPGTDPWMACNAFDRRTASGALRGLPVDYFLGEKLGQTANLHAMLTTTVAATLVGKKDDVVKTALASFLFGDRKPDVVLPRGEAVFAPFALERAADPKEARLRACMETPDKLLGYKARPLTGIWATGPFLHNGSVPNLYQLLLPPAERVPSFPVGTREFDPRHVGYSIDPSAPGNTQVFSAVDGQGRPIPGNSNAGHDYGNGRLDERGRLALVEYMKKL